ncbi:superoxide dismutase family protein [Fretibacter rubidus]|uniref:superoxide dismutase family protein n=1 Tax=Fretibacter rubidus TaxID=570162 RepID=UPI00352AB15B
MPRLTPFPAALATLALLTLGACNDDNANRLDRISNDISTNTGEVIGTVTLTSLGTDGVQVDVIVNDILSGTHAMHFHEFGKCEAPDFKSSGGHFNPDGKAHGMNMPDGPHAGDMMNVEADAAGNGIFSVINDRVSLRGDYDLPALLDADGTALILHERADDYETQPTGAAGARIGCAVIGG